jgi:RHS repeat-associated protein
MKRSTFCFLILYLLLSFRLMAGVSVFSGPSVRIPGINTPTVLTLTGPYADYPKQWYKDGMLTSNVVTVPGSYAVMVNLNPDGPNPLWVQAGSITIPALSNYVIVNGANPLSSSALTSLSHGTNGGAYLTVVKWLYNGVNTNITGSNYGTIFQPGNYSVESTYQYGGQSVTLTSLVVQVQAASNAPVVSFSKLTIDPVTAAPVLTVANFSSFSTVYWYKNGQYGGVMTSAALPITAAGRYYFMAVIPYTPSLYSYEYEVKKIPIPTPVIFGYPFELTWESSELSLRVGDSYNAGYTWRYNDVVLPNANNQYINIEKPGSYQVTACATHSDGEIECKTSATVTVTGRGPKVNAVIRKTAKAEGIMTEQQLNTLPKEQLSQSATYFDGFVRPVQMVEREGSPLGRDFVTVNYYDNSGRESMTYLPISMTSKDGNYRYINPQNAQAVFSFYRASNDNIVNTVSPYAVDVYESSALNRLKEKGAPGEDWQPGTNHTVRTRYMIYKQTGTGSDVLLWEENAEGQLTTTRYYPDGSLTIIELTDGNGNIHRQFTDKLGRKIMAESPADGEQRLRTYYVYDDLNRLKYILPPKMSTSVLALPFTITTTQQQQLCYYYQYDQRGRLIVKQLPGAEPELYVYDQWDRQVLKQTGNQRATELWSFTKYDAFDRPVMTGEVLRTGDRAALQQLITDFYADVSTSPTLRYEEKGSAFHNYTNRTYPLLSEESQVNVVTYYDNYGFIPAGSTQYNFQPQADLALTETFSRLKGLVTGVKTRILGTSEYLLSVTYYDKRNRIVQVIGDHHLAGTDVVSTQYDFEGKILKSKRTHQRNSQSTTIVEENTYDHAGRPLSISHKINNQTPVLLLENHYNELGQLIEKNLHGKDGNFMQSMDYQYNVRGWIAAVNRDSETGPLYPDMYGFELSYNELLSGIGNTPQYNGNVSAYTEHRPFEQENSQTLRSGYTYIYDAADRLKTASYIRPSDPLLNNAFNEDLSYDANSNITTLQRKSLVAGLPQIIDQLTYSYTGNQLRNVTDAASAQLGFKDVVNTADYGYDASGNLTRDGNKAIASIQYNILNLPSQILFADGRSITFTYSATGKKLTQLVRNADGSVKSKHDYAGGILYKDDVIESIQHAEGRLIPKSSGQWVYQYNEKDHLGNVRMTFSASEDDIHFTATMETQNTETESNRFGQSYDKAVTYTSPLFNHTPDGSTSVRLSGATERETVALATSRRVVPGDKILLEVFAKYTALTSEQSNANRFMLSALTIGLGSGTGTLGEAGQAYQSFSALDQAGLLIHSGDEVNTHAPRAYVNYILFDTAFIPYDAGFRQITENALENGSGVPHEHLQLETPVITRPGFIYTYLSYEDDFVADVYFDDFTLTHIASPIVESTTYYPFGMVATQYAQSGLIDQRLKYNNKELIGEEDLNWSDYGARMYDAALGRWHIADPLSEKYSSCSPYTYTLNNPVKYIDPNGADVVIAYETDQGRTEYFVFDGSENARYNAKMIPDKGISFVRDVIAAYDYNLANGAKMGNKGGQRLQELVTSRGYNAVIRQGDVEQKLKEEDYESASDQNMSNPYSNPIEITWDPTTSFEIDGASLSPATMLEHEADHAVVRRWFLKHDFGALYFNLAAIEIPGWRNIIEVIAIMGAEEETAVANGEIKPGQGRKSHGGGAVRVFKVNKPTSTSRVRTIYNNLFRSRRSHLMPDTDEESGY